MSEKKCLPEPTYISDELKAKITFYPPDWPDKPIKVKPGNLDIFASKGVGPCGCLTVMPRQDTNSIINRLNYYSYDNPSSHPFAGAPLTEHSGGIIYYSEDIYQPLLNSLLKIMDIRGHEDQYAAFILNSQKPKEDCYLTQLRIVSRFALRSKYGAIDENDYESFPKQQYPLNESLWLFMEDQRKFWTWKKLSGILGGDGDMAFEKLAFGLMVENSSDEIYRIWSRAWLITK